MRVSLALTVRYPRSDKKNIIIYLSGRESLDGMRIHTYTHIIPCEFVLLTLHILKIVIFHLPRL